MNEISTLNSLEPRIATIGDQTVTIRAMTADDRDSVLVFARSLPEEDLLFLSLDITDPAIVDQWVRDLEMGRVATLVAESNGAIVGYASLIHNQLRWMRHMGEIRIQLSPVLRGCGLGKLLVNEIVTFGHQIGLRKVIARMPTEQRGAVQVFDRLGFKAEALLADHVIDAQDRTHDLIVMSHDVTGFTS